MVAIKDMEMPKYCNDCDFVADSLGYCERATEHIPNYDFFSDTNEKPNWCPLTEIEERKVGKWIKEDTLLGWDGHSYQCSVCGRSIHLDTEVEDLEDYPYCHCGAEMEIGEDGKWIDD